MQGKTWQTEGENELAGKKPTKKRTEREKSQT
jgi:hypothetical protein